MSERTPTPERGDAVVGVGVVRADGDAPRIGDRPLLAMAAHDMRIPIAVVSGYARLLRDSSKALSEAERADVIDRIVRNADRLAFIVEDMLTIASAERPDIDLARTRVDLAKLVAEVVVDCGLQRTVEARVEDGLEVWIDRHRFARLLTNLVTNAFVHGAPPIEISCRQLDDQLVVRVCDHGPGVPDAFVPSLFEPFAQHRREPDGARRGAGLGLAIVRALAGAHGGSVHYDGDGSGAAFVVRVPMTTG